MLPGWEPQNVRFWKSQGKVAKSPPIETRPNFQLIRLSKYFCSNHIWVRRTVCPRPQTSCTSWKVPSWASSTRLRPAREV